MCKVILFAILLFIIILNFKVNIIPIETYCVAGTSTDPTLPTSPYYVGMQDAFDHANNNITSYSVTSGLRDMNYDLTKSDNLCKKAGFENGIAIFSSIRNEIKNKGDENTQV